MSFLEISLVRLLVHWAISAPRYVVYLLASVILTENTARLPGSAVCFVALRAAFNAAVGSVYLCVSVFRDVAVLPALKALGRLYELTYLAAGPIHADRELLKKLPSCL